VSRVRANEQISVFGLTTLSIGFYAHKHHVFQASPSSENQKAVNCSDSAFEKACIMKSALFVEREFSRERDNKTYPIFSIKKVVPRIERMMPSMWDFGG
jgi:hypothetical protein